MENEITVSITFDPFQAYVPPIRDLEGYTVTVTRTDGTAIIGTVYRACTNDPDGDWVLEIKGYDPELAMLDNTHHEIKHKTITNIRIH